MTITKEGAMASFYAMNKAPIRHLKVYFSPKQAGSGDASPENIRVISGINGIELHNTNENLFNAKNPNVVSVNSWMSGTRISESSTDRVIYIKCLPNTTYTISKTVGAVLAVGYTTILPEAGVSYYGHLRDNSGRKLTITTGADAKYLAAWCYDSTKTADQMLQPEDIYNSLQIEYGDTQTALHQYLGYDYTLDWSNDIGTLYNGYVDLITGEVVINYKLCTITGDESGLKYSWDGALLPVAGSYSSNEGVRILACSHTSRMISGGWFYQSSRTVNPNITETPICVAGSSGSQLRFRKRDLDPNLTMDIELYRTWLRQQNANGTPLQIVYQLQTPVTYQLTPTELQTFIGRNNIWSNADRVEVEYDHAESNDELYRRRSAILRSYPHLEEASGRVAHFETNATLPLKEAKVTITTYQSGNGDPSPNNVREIMEINSIKVTQCGKNLFDVNSYPLARERWISGEIGSAGENSQFQATQMRFVPTAHLQEENITLNKRPGGMNPGFAFYSSSSSKTFISGIINNNATAGMPMTVTVPLGARYMRFTTPDGATDIQIELGNQATTYEPYQEIVNTINLPSTICEGVLNLLTGELYVDTGVITIDDTMISNMDTLTGRIRFWTPTNSIVPYADYGNQGPQAALYASNLLCAPNGSSGNTSLMPSICIAHYNSQAYIAFRDTSGLTDLASVKAWVHDNPIQLVYRLKTPITYTLTPLQLRTLRGTNNIYTDANSSLEIKYWTH